MHCAGTAEFLLRAAKYFSAPAVLSVTPVFPLPIPYRRFPASYPLPPAVCSYIA